MTLYLVRLLQGFRFPDGAFDWRRSPHPPVVRAFATREAAESFALLSLPIWQNPFDTRAIHVSKKEIETWRWDDDLYDRADPDAGRQATSWGSFWKTLDALDLPHPKLPSGEKDWRQETQQALARWWYETPMTDAQKTALWQLLDPHPYRIDEVELS